MCDAALPTLPLALAFVLVVVHFQFGKVGLNLAVAGARIQAESGFVGQAQLNVAVAVVDLHVAQRAHSHFNRAVVILQANVAGNLFQADVLRARGQVQRAGDLLGVQFVGIEVESRLRCAKTPCRCAKT